MYVTPSDPLAFSLFSVLPNELTEIILKLNWTGRVIARSVCLTFKYLLPAPIPSAWAILTAASLDSLEFRLALGQETPIALPPYVLPLITEVAEYADSVRWLITSGCPRSNLVAKRIAKKNSLTLIEELKLPRSLSLHYAAKRGDLEVVKKLKSVWCPSAVKAAARGNQLAVLKLMAGDARISSITTFDCAVERGSTELLIWLLERLQTHNHLIALTSLAQFNRLDVIECLDNIKCRNEVALMRAVIRGGRPEPIELLERRGFKREPDAFWIALAAGHLGLFPRPEPLALSGRIKRRLVVDGHLDTLEMLVNEGSLTYQEIEVIAYTYASFRILSWLVTQGYLVNMSSCLEVCIRRAREGDGLFHLLCSKGQVSGIKSIFPQLKTRSQIATALEFFPEIKIDSELLSRIERAEDGSAITKALYKRV